MYKLLLSFLLLAGCSVNVDKVTPPRVVYLPTPLTLPVKPTLPKLSSSELECLNDDTKKLLLQRDIIMKNYVNELEVVIKSTHSK